MFGAPIEDWYVWIGVSIVGVAVLGVAIGLPAVSPPAAADAAETVDRVATSPPGSTATRPIRAAQVRLDRRRIGLRGPGGTARATTAFGSITPTAGDERLERVLAGEPPGDAFSSPAAFRNVVAQARNGSTGWRTAPETLRVRRVVWEGTDALLVG